MENRPYLYIARSHFSLGESLLSPKKIASIAKRDGHSTVALVDTMTISGMTDFLSECKKQEIKPIIGCRLRIVMDLDYRNPSKTAIEVKKPNPEWFAKVFVKNEQGMSELMHLLSLANSPERFYEKARLSFEDLLAVLKNGNLLFSTGDLLSIFTLKEKNYNYQLLLDKLNAQIDAKNVFYELFNADSILFNTLNKKCLKSALDSAGQILVTNLLLYDEARDADTLDVLSVITSNQKMTDGWRNIQQLKTFHTKGEGAVNDESHHIICKTVRDLGIGGHGFVTDGAKQYRNEFVEACQYEWKSMPVSLPKMAEDEGLEMVRQITIGWKERIKKPVMGYVPPEELIPEYKKRLAYELSVLRKMGFERYFLVVQDLVKWSKSKGILVGPGRGSCFLPGHRVVLDKSGVTEAIENIKIGDSVIAHDGSTRCVVATLEFERDEEIIELEFDNGVTIECTKDHKFFTKNRGWVVAEEISCDDEFDDVAKLARGLKPASSSPS